MLIEALVTLMISFPFEVGILPATCRHWSGGLCELSSDWLLVLWMLREA